MNLRNLFSKFGPATHYTWQRKKLQRMFVGKYKVKTFLERSMCRLGYNIKLDLK